MDTLGTAGILDHPNEFDTLYFHFRVRDNTPHLWYDSDIDDAREKKRKLENVWRTKLEIHRQLYVTAHEECTILLSARKADYYKKRLEKANNNTVFRLLRSLDGQRIQQHPEFHSTAQGGELFSHFFSEKIDKLLSGLQCLNTIDRPTKDTFLLYRLLAYIADEHCPLLIAI